MIKLSLEADKIIKEQDEDHESNDVLTAREEHEEIKEEQQISGDIKLSIQRQKEQSRIEKMNTFDDRDRSSRKRIVREDEIEQVGEVGLV